MGNSLANDMTEAQLQKTPWSRLKQFFKFRRDKNTISTGDL